MGDHSGNNRANTYIVLLVFRVKCFSHFGHNLPSRVRRGKGNVCSLAKTSRKPLFTLAFSSFFIWSKTAPLDRYIRSRQTWLTCCSAVAPHQVVSLLATCNRSDIHFPCKNSMTILCECFVPTSSIVGRSVTEADARKNNCDCNAVATVRARQPRADCDMIVLPSRRIGYSNPPPTRHTLVSADTKNVKDSHRSVSITQYDNYLGQLSGQIQPEMQKAPE